MLEGKEVPAVKRTSRAGSFPARRGTYPKPKGEGDRKAPKKDFNLLPLDDTDLISMGLKRGSPRPDPER